MSTIVVSGCNDASINAGGPPQPRSSAAALAISHGAGVTIGLAVVVASTWCLTKPLRGDDDRAGQEQGAMQIKAVQ